jgi:putative RecB family exonuclease
MSSLTTENSDLVISTAPAWSATRLKAYVTCPRQYAYAYVDRIPSVPTAPLVFGRTLHEALLFVHERQMAERTLPPVTETLRHFDGLWRRALDEEQPFFRTGAPSPEQHQTIAHEILRAYLSAPENAALPLAAELAFEVKHEEHRLCGVMDRLDEGETGLVVVDYNSGARKPSLSDVERDMQLTLYAFAASKLLGQPVERVVHYHLRDGSRFESERGDGDFAWLLDQVLPHVAQAVETEQFPRHVGHWCNWCDFREVCRAEQSFLANAGTPGGGE